MRMKAPKSPPPPQAPPPDTSAEDAAMAKERVAIRQRRGRQSTLLAGQNASDTLGSSGAPVSTRQLSNVLGSNSPTGSYQG